ncbi:MAG TPA: RidA family protein [Caulobacteraceae bacterium]|nr:RidA family protein [Caulobacteraceae bacterium]
MATPDDRLEALGLKLPPPAAPAANYVPFVRAGSLVHIAGQVSVDGGGGIRGTVGKDLDLATGQAAARLCALNLLAQMKAAADGDWSRLKRVVKLGGFVQAGPDFIDIPQVVNGCSDLIVDVLGEAGRHARSAVGVYRLPFDFAVEVDAIIEVAEEP